MNPAQRAHFAALYATMSDEELAYLCATHGENLSEEAASAFQSELQKRDPSHFENELQATRADIASQTAFALNQEAAKATPMRHLSVEACGALLCIAAGVAVSAALALRDTSPSAFASYWLPHACILAMLSPLRPRPALFAGVALALAGYLAAYDAWVLSTPHPDYFVWMSYFFSFPGGGIGAFAAAFWQKRHATSQTAIAGLVALGAVLAGVIANLAIVCGTFMNCP